MMVTLQFRQGEPLKIHRDLLHRNSKLRLLDISENSIFGEQGHKWHSLKHISRSAGHVLVQYLYTGTYSTLTWKGPTGDQREIIAKLRTAFEVYDTAHQYDLEELVELAREQITASSKNIDAFVIVDIVKEAHPTAKGNDVWFRSFIKDMIKTAFEKPPTPLPAKAGETNATVLAAEDQLFSQDVPLAKILLQGALEVHREKIEAASKSPPLFHSSTTTTTKENGDSREEPEPVPREESLWGFSISKNRKSEGKNSDADTPTTPVEEFAWESFVSNNKKKKRESFVMGIEPGSQPICEEKPGGSEAEPKLAKDDPWDTWVSSKKKSTWNKKGKIAYELIPEPVPELSKDITPEPQPVKESEVETDPVGCPVEETWVGGDSDPSTFFGRKQSSPRDHARAT